MNILKKSESQGSLSPYLPVQKRGHNNHAMVVQNIERQIQKTKAQLLRMQKVYQSCQIGVNNKMNKINQYEKQIDCLYSAQIQNMASEDKATEIKQQIKYNDKSEQIDNIFNEQMAKLLQIQGQIGEFSDKIQQRLNKIRQCKMDNQLQNLKHLQLPEPKELSSQLLEQMNICQQKFNKWMDQSQSNIDKQLKNYEKAQKLLLEQMGVIIESRIASLQSHIKIIKE